MKKLFAINLTAHVEVNDEEEARAIAKKTDELLGKSMTKAIFKGQGIPLVGHKTDLDPKPL